jgi:predicted alpha/beta superfamily hydrolase
MKLKIILIISLLFFTFTLQAQNSKIKEITPFSIGQTLHFYSDILQEDRSLNIYLPQSYQPDSLTQYPIIYLLDGSADEDFVHIAGLVQFGSFPWIEMLPESIVVGIANVDRRRDFTYPTRNEKDKRDFPTTGGSAKFMEFLEKEVQPLINKQYPGNGSSTIIGQSLGGLLATEVLWKKPDLFDHYIIISPSLWWDDESLLHEKRQTYSSPKSIYIAVGKEGDIMERTAKELAEKVPQEETEVFFDFFGDQDHGNILHLAVYKAFEQIFGKK